MKRAALALVLLAVAAPSFAQLRIEVRTRESVVLQINAATAAYSVDETIATASGHDGLVTVFGRNAGTTRIMVVALGRTVGYDAVVLAPLSVQRTIVPQAQGANARPVITEARYVSSTGQVQTTVDTAAAHAVVLRDRQRTSMPSASIQIGKTTLLDKRVEDSPLTTTNNAVRGIHFFSDAWRVHAGVTASTFYDSLVIPSRRQFILGAARAWQLAPKWRVTPGVYGVAGRGDHRGGIASVLAEYDDGDRLTARGEIGFSRGIGGALQLFSNGEKSHFRTSLRWQPRDFTTLGVDDVRGFTGDADYSRSIGKLDLDAGATATHTILAVFDERAMTSQADLRYHATRSLTLLGGATYGSFRTRIPASGSIRSFTIPVGFAASYGNAGLSAIYRVGDNTSRGRANGFRVSGSYWHGAFRASAFVDRQDDAPTIAIFTERYPELAGDLARAGIVATSMGDIARLLRQAATLTSLGITSVPRVDLALRRQQTSADLAWRELRLRYIRSDAETVSGSTSATFMNLTWKHRLAGATELEASYGFWMTGGRREPIYELALRHRFDGLPSITLGEISGSVYRDDERARTPLGGVEVRLDDARSTRTDNNGRYTFGRVAASSHRVSAQLPADDAYFTTPSHAEVSAGERLDFGIAFSPAKLNVVVVDDGGRGVNGIGFELSGGVRRITGTSGSGGAASFSLQPGTWIASVDDATIPAGYTIDGQDSHELALSRAHAATVKFILHANRSISGRVEGARGVIAIRVTPGDRRVLTDEKGQFAIRSLAAGPVTLHVSGRTATRSLVLPNEPAAISDVVLTR